MTMLDSVSGTDTFYVAVRPVGPQGRVIEFSKPLILNERKLEEQLRQLGFIRGVYAEPHYVGLLIEPHSWDSVPERNTIEVILLHSGIDPHYMCFVTYKDYREVSENSVSFSLGDKELTNFLVM